VAYFQIVVLKAMITYSPGYWGVCFSFAYKGSVLPKAVVWAVPCAIATYLCHVYYHHHFKEWDSSDIGVQLMASFTFVLGFLIVFRVNQAYSRWWEGGTLLLKVRGEWFNAYSSLIALCNTSDEKSTEVRKFQNMLCRLMSLLYGAAILQVCTVPEPTVEIVEIKGFDEEHMKHLENCHDKVEVIMQWIQRSVVAANDSQIVKAAAPILTRFYNQLGNGMSILVSARKIGEFPIPFPVAQLITIMLIFNWACTVVVAVMAVNDEYWAAVLAFLSQICLWSINYVAVELEMPFGDDLNDLPLQHLQADMNASLIGLLHPRALQAPNFELEVSPNHELKAQHLAFKEDGTMDLAKVDVFTTPSSKTIQGCGGVFAKICRRRGKKQSLVDFEAITNGISVFHVPRMTAGRRKICGRTASKSVVIGLLEETVSKRLLRNSRETEDGALPLPENGENGLNANGVAQAPKDEAPSSADSAKDATLREIKLEEQIFNGQLEERTAKRAAEGLQRNTG